MASGRDRGSYYHPLFLRGRPDVCKIIFRTSGSKVGQEYVLTTNADDSMRQASFYDLVYCPPVDMFVKTSRTIKRLEASVRGGLELLKLGLKDKKKPAKTKLLVCYHYQP